MSRAACALKQWCSVEHVAMDLESFPKDKFDQLPRTHGVEGTVRQPVAANQHLNPPPKCFISWSRTGRGGIFRKCAPRWTAWWPRSLGACERPPSIIEAAKQGHGAVVELLLPVADIIRMLGISKVVVPYCIGLANMDMYISWSSYSLVNVDVDGMDKDRSSPLHFATRDAEAVKLLLHREDITTLPGCLLQPLWSCKTASRARWYRPECSRCRI
jgi:hypothetical protein